MYRNGIAPLLAISVLVCELLWSAAVSAADIEAGAWPEIDIWIGLDDEQRNRIYILKSFTEEPSFSYQEEATGISLDHRINKRWSVRAGARYIGKLAEPPDANETRVVLDAKWYQDLGNDWLLTDRNRIDIRWLEGADEPSYRYRNRIQLEKPFTVGGTTLTGFGSFELYYDTRFDAWQRKRAILGISIPFGDSVSVDIFYGYHAETKPKIEHADAVGVAFGIYFY
jgi:hypothetical protein